MAYINSRKRELMEERDPEIYDAEPYVAEQSMSGHWNCPVPGCVGGVATSIPEEKQLWRIRNHFIDRHPTQSFVLERGIVQFPISPNADES